MRLAQALATLRIAERQGIGVDRMHRDMLVLGLPAPVIEQLPGPIIRTTLIGGQPEEVWLSLRADLQPPSARSDLDFLLVLSNAVRSGWISGAVAAAQIQRSRPETSDVLSRLTDVRVGEGGAPALVGVEGDPAAGRDPYDAAWQPSREVRERLSTSARHQAPSRECLLAEYAHQRGRISSTEAASLLDASVNTARAVLDDLERQGTLRTGREQRRGRGFFYVPAR